MAKNNSQKMSRPPLARMMRLHEELKEGHYPNCAKLSLELEVTGRTLRRDFDFMRDQLGLPIEYDSRRYGYYYSQPVTGFPTLQVSEGELVALFVAQKAMAQYRGTVFEKPLSAAFAKLAGSLPDRITVQAGNWDSLFSFKTLGAPVSDLKLFSALSGALRRMVKVRFGYRKLRSKEHEMRTVRPYHLSCVDNQWYLFGYDEDRAGIRTFALPRMCDLTVLDATFLKPEDFSPSEMLSDSFGIFSGRKKQTVRIRFDLFAAQLVRERLWHSSQRFRNLRDGGVELTLVLGSLPEVERWLLSWGGHAEVLAPAELRKSVAATSAQMALKYADGGKVSVARR